MLFCSVLIIDFHFYADKKYGHFAEFAFGMLVYLIYRKRDFSTSNIKLGLVGCLVSILWFVLANLLYVNGFTYLRFIGF